MLALLTINFVKLPFGNFIELIHDSYRTKTKRDSTRLSLFVLAQMKRFELLHRETLPTGFRIRTLQPLGYICKADKTALKYTHFWKDLECFFENFWGERGGGARRPREGGGRGGPRGLRSDVGRSAPSDSSVVTAWWSKALLPLKIILICEIVGADVAVLGYNNELTSGFEVIDGVVVAVVGFDF